MWARLAESMIVGAVMAGVVYGLNLIAGNHYDTMHYFDIFWYTGTGTWIGLGTKR